MNRMAYKLSDKERANLVQLILDKSWGSFELDKEEIGYYLEKFLPEIVEALLEKKTEEARNELTLKLNDKGQCPICEIKPLPYKRDYMFFCHRCCRAFNDKTGNMIANFAYEGNVRPTRTHKKATENMMVIHVLDKVARDFGIPSSGIIEFRQKYLS